MLKLGVISDTHGFYNERINDLFYDCNHIFHTGDIGCITIIERLQKIAPTTWVKGNCDFISKIPINTPYESNIQQGQFRIYLTHRPEDIDSFLHKLDYENTKNKLTYICLHGHTHIGRINTGENALPAKLIFNPGSASDPRGFNAQPSVGLIEIDRLKIISAKIINMDGICLMKIKLQINN